MQRLIPFILIILLLAACAPAVNLENNPPKTPQELQPTPDSDALFVVVKPDGSEVGFTWDDLKKLPLAAMTAEGKVEEGVKLMDVLTAAGVNEFTEVSLSGSRSPATLTFEQVQDETTILDFTNHGTVKLATPHVPKADWTKDVARIEVK